VKSRVSRARRALHAILEDGAYDRDGGPAGDAMRSILADAERLSTAALRGWAKPTLGSAEHDPGPADRRAVPLALLPVLVLGGVQTAIIAFHREADVALARTWNAPPSAAPPAPARAWKARRSCWRPWAWRRRASRMRPAADGPPKQRIPGYANLIRFDAIGRVACAAATTCRPTAARATASGSSELAGGRPW
jgi:hypothetical protein